MADIKLTKAFHALAPDLPLDDSDRKALRLAIVIDCSNYEHTSWKDLNDDQAKEAIQVLKKTIARLKKT